MIFNALILALREIRRNVLRSFLTVLGVVIGVAAVIIMVTVGGGVTAKVKQNMSKLGTNLLMISPGQFRGPSGGPSDAKPFVMQDVTALRREIAGLAAVAPVSSKSLAAIHGNANWSTTVRGTDNEHFEVQGWTLEQGRFFSDQELRAGRAVCVIGETVRKELFPIGDALGERIRLQKITCQVIGILAAKGNTGMGHDQDDVVVVPLRTLQRRVSGNQYVDSIQVSVLDSYSTQTVKEQIETLLRERRNISPTESDNFEVHDMTEIVESMQSTTKVMTSLLGAVAAVSLLVGGIGIMNIMLVSITERTREIGTRLAIGALERDVMVQFLVEALVLSSLGGLVGIGLALAGSFALVRLLDVPFLFNVGINLLAFVFSAAVGVAFGFFPARKAARLDPIEALRYE